VLKHQEKAAISKKDQGGGGKNTKSKKALVFRERKGSGGRTQREGAQSISTKKRGGRHIRL